MRVIFTAGIFLFSVLFLIFGLKYDYIARTGQLGSGFFPIWIGALLIVTTSIALLKDIKVHLKEKPKMKISGDIVTLLIILGLTILFIASLRFLGAMIGMVIYIFVVLYVLNKKQLI